MSQTYLFALLGIGLPILTICLAAAHFALRKHRSLPAQRALLLPIAFILAGAAVEFWSRLPEASGVLGPMSVATVVAALATPPWTPLAISGIAAGFILPMMMAGILFWSSDIWTSTLAWILALFFILQALNQIKKARRRVRG